jgi:hypothetical protein
VCEGKKNWVSNNKDFPVQALPISTIFHSFLSAAIAAAAIAAAAA